MVGMFKSWLTSVDVFLMSNDKIAEPPCTRTLPNASAVCETCISGETPAPVMVNVTTTALWSSMTLTVQEKLPRALGVKLSGRLNVSPPPLS